MMSLKEWIDKQDSFGAFRELREMAEEGWLISSIMKHRDSDCLAESNFACALERLGGESETVQVLHFGHWAVGWTEWIATLPQHQEAVEKMEDALDSYPVLDEDDYSERETNAANDVWRDCYNTKERIAYIKKHPSQFEFNDFADLMGCVRGHYFAGYAGDLLS
jgi:hypothetical protein